MARPAKLSNPHLMAVNPYGEKKKPSKKNPSTVKASKNPSVSDILTKGGAAGVGAVLTTFISNLLPLPTNPLLNAVTKAGVGVGVGYLAGMLNATKPISEYVMAGGVGVAAADALRFVVPKFRTVFVSDLPQAEAVKQVATTLNDIVVVEDGQGQMGDIVDSMAYNSEWATV